MTTPQSNSDSAIARRLAQLSPEKRALLERSLMAQRQAALDNERINVRAPGDPAPLSFAQQRLWFFDCMSPMSPTYNACVGMRLLGPVDRTLLTDAFNTAILRHEVLRTVLPDTDGMPEQQVLETWEFDIALHDLTGLDEATLDAELVRLAVEEPRKGYDLQRDLMMRVALVKLAENDHVLLLMEHHIAFDGWSDEILCREVSECYAAARSGVAPKLEPLAVQYRDFAVWQRDRLQGERLESLQQFWRSYLSGAPSLASLPTDRPRPPEQAFDGSRVYIDLDAQTLERIHARAREDGATPFMLLLAAFEALLCRWAGLTDITIGTPIASRIRIELEQLIGFFSNTLVIRGTPTTSMTMRELVAQARDRALIAFEHQELPFDKIVEAVQPPRSPSYNPLFQINFRVTGGGDATLDLPGVVASQYSVDIGFSRFDLAMELQLLDDRVGGYLEYNLGLFEEGTARSVVEAFTSLLKDSLARPDVPIGDLALAAPTQGPSMRRARRG